MTPMHNVRVERIQATREAAAQDPTAAQMEVSLTGEWQVDEALPQFIGPVKFAQGEVAFEADFPPFLGGDGRAPSPLMYCFYGAMCCYAVTFATQAAIEGMELRTLSIGLQLSVDFRPALGMGNQPPISPFAFEVSVETDASDAEVQRIKQLADERCPAIWAMSNPVPHSTTVRRR